MAETKLDNTKQFSEFETKILEVLKEYDLDYEVEHNENSLVIKSDAVLTKLDEDFLLKITVNDTDVIFSIIMDMVPKVDETILKYINEYNKSVYGINAYISKNNYVIVEKIHQNIHVEDIADITRIVIKNLTSEKSQSYLKPITRLTMKESEVEEIKANNIKNGVNDALCNAFGYDEYDIKVDDDNIVTAEYSYNSKKYGMRHDFEIIACTNGYTSLICDIGIAKTVDRDFLSKINEFNNKSIDYTVVVDEKDNYISIFINYQYMAPEQISAYTEKFLDGMIEDDTVELLAPILDNITPIPEEEEEEK